MYYLAYFPNDDPSKIYTFYVVEDVHIQSLRTEIVGSGQLEIEGPFITKPGTIVKILEILDGADFRKVTVEHYEPFNICG